MTDSERLEDSQAAERGAGQLDTCCCWSDRRLALTLLSSEQQTKVPRWSQSSASPHLSCSVKSLLHSKLSNFIASRRGIMLSSGGKDRLRAASALPTWQTLWRQQPTGCLYFSDQHDQAGSLTPPHLSQPCFTGGGGSGGFSVSRYSSYSRDGERDRERYHQSDRDNDRYSSSRYSSVTSPTSSRRTASSSSRSAALTSPPAWPASASSRLCKA